MRAKLQPTGRFQKRDSAQTALGNDTRDRKVAVRIAAMGHGCTYLQGENNPRLSTPRPASSTRASHSASAKFRRKILQLILYLTRWSVQPIDYKNFLFWAQIVLRSTRFRSGRY